VRPRAWAAAVALALAALALPAIAQRAPTPAAPVGEIHVDQLSKEAKATIALIRKGGPYPYAKDGAIFGNREGLLPKQKRGYYREYTVKTPGERTRGARRIVVGSAGEMYLTEDHYNHFRLIRKD
jgi:ribonuclease T1